MKNQLKSRQQVLMDEYAVSHQNPLNKRIHFICVPLIFLTVLSFFWYLPAPEIGLGESRPYFWPLFSALVCLIVYGWIGASAVAAMLPQIALMHLVLAWAHSRIPFWIWFGLFVVSWIGQFVGHKIEGKKPSFFTDLLFLFVGPLWVSKSLSQRKSSHSA